MKGAVLGVLLMAHGGNADWNKTVENIRAELDAKAPTALALGMADPSSLQRAVDDLRARKVDRIVAVPLFVHSQSEVLAHTKYVLGVSDEPSAVLRDALAAWHAAHAQGAGKTDAKGDHAHHHSFSMERVESDVPIAMAKALDDHPRVAQALARRAKALSRAPTRETVILAGHGPVDEKANEAWIETMRLQAGRVKASGRFRTVSAATIRDDSPAPVKAAAIADLRRRVSEGLRDGGRVIVVPYLIARGGIEGHIVEALEGLTYAWDGRTLCPDPAMASILWDRIKEAE